MVDLCHRINAADVNISHNTDNLLNLNYTEHSCGWYTPGSQVSSDRVMTTCIDYWNHDSAIIGGLGTLQVL